MKTNLRQRKRSVEKLCELDLSRFVFERLCRRVRPRDTRHVRRAETYITIRLNGSDKQ